MGTTSMDPTRDVAQPVTVVVTRRVKPGREPSYEAWLERLIREASVLPGYLVYGLVLSIGTLVALVLGAAPMPLRLLATITIEVFFMTYVLMPRLTRWLARWIYPSRKRAPS